MDEQISVLAPFSSCRERLCCPCEVTWVRFPLLSSPLDGMGFVIVAVLSPSASTLATVAGAATLVGPEQPREKSSILPRRDVCR